MPEPEEAAAMPPGAERVAPGVIRSAGDGVATLAAGAPGGGGYVAHRATCSQDTAGADEADQDALKQHQAAVHQLTTRAQAVELGGGAGPCYTSSQALDSGHA